jgi:hypothetical protein
MSNNQNPIITLLAPSQAKEKNSRSPARRRRKFPNSTDDTDTAPKRTSIESIDEAGGFEMANMSIISPYPNHPRKHNISIPEYDTIQRFASQQRVTMYNTPPIDWERRDKMDTYAIDEYDVYTGRLVYQHEHNFINYLHPCVRKELGMDGERYYVMKNTPTYHIPISEDDHVMDRIYIPHPQEQTEIPKSMTQIPYLWKHLSMPLTVHPENDTMYSHMSVNQTQTGNYYQILFDDRFIYVRKLPHPSIPAHNSQTSFEYATGPFPWVLTSKNVELMREAGKLPLQHPNNWINYRHANVFKIIKDHKEVFFTVPNDKTYHTPTVTTFKWKQIIELPHPMDEAPFPVRRKETKFPYLWKHQYLEEIDYKGRKDEVTHKSNYHDYYRNDTFCTYDEMFYSLTPGLTTASIYRLPQPGQEYKLQHRIKHRQYDVPKLIKSPKD